jgi:hypothetical protein
LEDDSISSTSKARICFGSSKGVGQWLIAKPSICSFHITHYIFTLVLHFCFDLIHLLASSIFMCECGNGLDAFGTHLAHCPFEGQWITTHDAIKHVMYAFVQENGHVVWKERCYTFMLKVSLRTNLYMTHEGQVLAVDVVVTNSIQKTMVVSVIS